MQIRKNNQTETREASWVSLRATERSEAIFLEFKRLLCRFAPRNDTGPNHADWDRFWNNDSTRKFTQISWSKRRILRVLKPYVICGQKALVLACTRFLMKLLLSVNGVGQEGDVQCMFAIASTR